jgi:hypothetical protein
MGRPRKIKTEVKIEVPEPVNPQKTKTGPIAHTPNKSTTKRTHYFVANHHTADIIFPRSGRENIRRPPLVLFAGVSTPVSADDWNAVRNNKGVKNYLDAGLISEVRREGEVSVSSSTSGDIPIPEFLQTPEELGVEGTTGIKATRRKKDVSYLTVNTRE